MTSRAANLVGVRSHGATRGICSASLGVARSSVGVNSVAVAAPAEIDDSLRLDKAPADATLTWADVPGPYGVYRGSNGLGGPWSYDQTCLASGVVVSTASDPVIPAPGEFFYYLITRFDQCRESIPGTDSTPSPIPNALPCPAP